MTSPYVDLLPENGLTKLAGLEAYAHTLRCVYNWFIFQITAGLAGPRSRPILLGIVGNYSTFYIGRVRTPKDELE